jgi:shikimate dehydrogenase
MKKTLAVIGHPIAHSLSPLMHNNELRALHLPYSYEAIDVSEEELGNVVNELRSSTVAGFNVTIPHKEKVMAHLDQVDEEAATIGAVNTVVNKHGKLVGYNTDGAGFLLALATICPNWKEKNILIVGAGGAARAIFVTLISNNAKVVDLTNRNYDKAVKLKGEANATHCNVLSIKEAERLLNEYDIVINTTPVGMASSENKLPIQLDNLKKGTILSDIIYTPLQTTWLQKGEEIGAITMNGLDMFVLQGALAFNHWTGVTPNKARMKQIVLHHLKGEK